MIDQRWITSEVLQWGLVKGGSRAKSCDDVWPRMDHKQSPTIMFGQGWIASEALQWCLTRGSLLNGQGTVVWQYLTKGQTRKGRYKRAREDARKGRCKRTWKDARKGRYVQGQVQMRKGELWRGKCVDSKRWENSQMWVRIVVRLKAIKYKKNIFRYLSSYAGPNFITPDLSSSLD